MVPPEIGFRKWSDWLAMERRRNISRKISERVVKYKERPALIIAERGQRRLAYEAIKSAIRDGIIKRINTDTVKLVKAPDEKTNG